MTNKELKRLNRKQLLELLLVQTERVEALEKELERANELLSERKINESEAGSIAEASLKLNGVFEAAEAAAAQYLENIKLKAENDTLTLPVEDPVVLSTEELIANADRVCREREKLCQERLAHINMLINERYAEYRKLGKVYEESANNAQEEEDD